MSPSASVTHWLRRLKAGDPAAAWKREGYTNDAMAAKLGCVPRSVERTVRVIRGLGTREFPP